MSQQSLQASLGPKSPQQPVALLGSLRAPSPATGFVMMRMPPPPSPSSSVVSAPSGSALLLTAQPQPGIFYSNMSTVLKSEFDFPTALYKKARRAEEEKSPFHAFFIERIVYEYEYEATRPASVCTHQLISTYVSQQVFTV